MNIHQILVYLLGLKKYHLDQGAFSGSNSPTQHTSTVFSKVKYSPNPLPVIIPLTSSHLTVIPCMVGGNHLGDCKYLKHKLCG